MRPQSPSLPLSISIESRAVEDRTDGELVEMARAGCHDSGAALFARYHGRLVSVLCRWTHGDRARAEDLAQDTWVKAFAHLERVDPDSQLWPWLRRIAVNTAISDGRRRHPVPAGDSTRMESFARVPPEDERIEELDLLLRSWKRLPGRHQAVLVAVDVDGASIGEAAASAGVSYNAMKQSLHRARRALRDAAGTALGAPWFRWQGHAGRKLARWLSPSVVGTGALSAVVPILVVTLFAWGPDVREGQRPMANTWAETDRRHFDPTGVPDGSTATPSTVDGVTTRTRPPSATDAGGAWAPEVALPSVGVPGTRLRGGPGFDEAAPYVISVEAEVGEGTTTVVEVSVDDPNTTPVSEPVCSGSEVIPAVSCERNGPTSRPAPTGS